MAILNNSDLRAHTAVVTRYVRRLVPILFVASIMAVVTIQFGYSAEPKSNPRVAVDDSEADAAALLEEAHEELELGEHRSALRRLEILVQRYPRSRSATDARVLIGQLRSQTPAPRRAEPRRADTPESAGGAAAIRHLANQFQVVAGDRVFFPEASVEIGGRARAVLEQQAVWLRQHPSVRITIEGHADDRGTPAFNLELSRQRATEVRDRLIADGVAAERISIAPVGRQRRIATCDGSDCAAQNRRVIVRVTGDARQSDHDGGIQDRR